MFYEYLNTPRYKRFWALDLEVNDIYINILFNVQNTVDHNNVAFFLQEYTKTHLCIYFNCKFIFMHSPGGIFVLQPHLGYNYILPLIDKCKNSSLKMFCH